MARPRVRRRRPMERSGGDLPTENGWGRRRTSLGRLAQAALGMQPMPTGKELENRWWCWKALSAGVPRPRVR